MENNQNKDMPLSADKITSLTPHELIQRHSEHPEQPITDEDMNNLDMSIDDSVTDESNLAEGEIPLSDKEKEEADKMADDLEKDNTGMSYNAQL